MKWRVERSIDGHGWFAMRGIWAGAWFPTWAEAMSFALSQAGVCEPTA